jgi:hypothetical protein
VQDSDCGCGLVCVNDLPVGNACEYACTTTADCPNAATRCTGNAVHDDVSAGDTCTINLCPGDAGPGAICDATALGSVDGTCVPIAAGIEVELCYPVGTASSCSGASNDNPNLATLGPFPTPADFVSPQPRDPAGLCPVGQACDAPAFDGGLCTALCTPALANCPAPQVCAVQGYSTDWGFCGPCLATGVACSVSSDCCNGDCQTPGFTCN